MIAHDYDKAIEVLSNLKNNVDKGTISEQRINESVYRILQLKYKYDLHDGATENKDITPINNEVKAVLKQYLK